MERKTAPGTTTPPRSFEMQDTTAKIKTVEVTVSFPLSKRGDYHHKAHLQETIGTLRAAAMEHFHAHEEAGSEYYLTNDKDNNALLGNQVCLGVSRRPPGHHPLGALQRRRLADHGQLAALHACTRGGSGMWL